MKPCKCTYCTVKPTPTLAQAKKLARVLAWVNRVRAKVRRKPLKKLPKGERVNAWACPIARACPGISGRRFSGSMLSHDDLFVEEPVHVAQFIRDFDARQYPWLECQ